MIHAYDLIEKLRDPIAQDATLETWCVSRYGRRQVVSVGWDHTKDPEEASCPLVVLRPGSDSAGQGATNNDVRVVVTMLLYEGRTKQDAPAGTRVPECVWVQYLHTFAAYVWAAAKTAMADSRQIKRISTDYNDAAFPLVQAASVYELSVRQCLGAAEPTL